MRLWFLIIAKSYILPMGKFHRRGDFTRLENGFHKFAVGEFISLKCQRYILSGAAMPRSVKPVLMTCFVALVSRSIAFLCGSAASIMRCSK